jgi:peroxiredoxin
MKIYFNFLMTITLVLLACNEQIQEKARFFTANPQLVSKQEVKTLEVGEKAPDFHLPGVDKFYSLSDFDGSEILVIIFTCNHCPTAQAYEERIKSIAEDYKDKSVQVVGISPNSPLGLLYEELGYSDLGDEFEENIIRAKDHEFNFPYLYDGDDQKVSLAYGPVATPHAYVFDKDRVLKYVGRIDRSEKPGTANAEDLRGAIDAVLSGSEIAEATTKTFGCSTKWGWKTEMREKVDGEWAAKDITLDDLTEEGLVELIKNENSEKLRLVNFWATWCGPCRLEYPEFVVIQRMFGARDFEFVSVSLDNLDKKQKALDFLNKSESALQNYISAVTDKYELIEMVDKNWNGALPYTLLIEPGGNVVWSHQGEVDFLELKRAIVGHAMIGRVY